MEVQFCSVNLGAGPGPCITLHRNSLFHVSLLVRVFCPSRQSFIPRRRQFGRKRWGGRRPKKNFSLHFARRGMPGSSGLPCAPVLFFIAVRNIPSTERRRFYRFQSERFFFRGPAARKTIAARYRSDCSRREKSAFTLYLAAVGIIKVNNACRR